jgi:hypothetical protein
VLSLISSSNSYSGDKIKENEMVCACSMHETINSYKIFFGNSEGKILPWRPRHRREDTIKMDVGGI